MGQSRPMWAPWALLMLGLSVACGPTGEVGAAEATDALTYNGDGVAVLGVGVSVSGTAASGRYTVRTQRTVTFRELVLAVRDAQGGNHDFIWNGNVTVKGQRLFSGSSASLASGPYTAQVAYTLDGSRWVRAGTQVRFTVGTSCIPTPCAAAGKDCGSVADGCGGTLNCGSCAAPQTCGGAGVANLCGGGYDGGNVTGTDGGTVGGRDGGTGGTPGGASFVRREGAALTLGGAPYRFGGANAWYLPWASPTERANALSDAAAMHLKVLRVFASLPVGAAPGTGSDTLWNIHGWGPTAEEGGSEGIYFQSGGGGGMQVNTGASGLVHLDALLQDAAAHGIRLLITLVDNWGFNGGTPQYCEWFGLAPTSQYGNTYCPQFYTQANLQAAYKSWVSSVILRTNSLTGVVYRDDPTIFAWELANEPSTDDNAFISWATGMSAYVKSLDPNHLVATGDVAVYSSSRFAATLAIPNVDLGTLHVYAEYGQPSSTVAGCTSGIQGFMDQAYAANKPCLLEEFGRDRSNADQPTTLQTWARTVRNGHGSGWMFWALNTHSDRTSPPGQYMPSDGWSVQHDGSATDQKLSAEAALIASP